MKKHPSTELRDFKEDAAWAETLDWRNNPYDFQQLIASLQARLDARYREEFGVRIDQLAGTDELLASAKLGADWFAHADKEYRHVGIYEYLHRDLERFLRKKLDALLTERKKRE